MAGEIEVSSMWTVPEVLKLHWLNTMKAANIIISSRKD